jgi:hypothetical protein
MQRRKFLVGMGSLAAGGAAAMGTGAFTSVSANRDVSVSVTGDKSAYLRLNPTSAYASLGSGNDTGELGIDFSGGEPEQNGSGVNTAAETEFDGVFEIKNQGTQEVNVWIARNSYDAPGAESVQVVTGEQTLNNDSVTEPVEIDIAQPPSRVADDIAPAGNGGDGLSANGPDVRPGGYVTIPTGNVASIGVNFFVSDAIGDFVKEWQINASTSTPSDAAYNDDNLQGHPDTDLSGSV